MKKSVGFTWIDMLVTMSVTIILATLTMITYHHFLLQNAISQTTRQLANVMLYARSQAIMHNEPIVLSGSDGDWTRGQRVIRHDKVLRVFPAISSHLRVEWVSNFSKNAALNFASNGNTDGQQGHFNVYTKGHVVATLIVTHSGRLRLENKESGGLAYAGAPS